MSRTKKGSKGPGWETWSKRPGSCFPPGRKSKEITNSKERMKASEELRRELVRLCNNLASKDIKITRKEIEKHIKKKYGK